MIDLKEDIYKKQIKKKDKNIDLNSYKQLLVQLILLKKKIQDINKLSKYKKKKKKLNNKSNYKKNKNLN